MLMAFSWATEGISTRDAERYVNQPDLYAREESQAGNSQVFLFFFTFAG
jgi:hypothetical protein